MGENDFNLPLFFLTFYYNFFKYAEKLKECYSENVYTYHRDSSINILLYLLYQYHTSVHLRPH